MNTFRNTFFLLLLAGFLTVPQAFAQSKKELRDENAVMKTQIEALQRQSQEIVRENRNLQERNNLLSTAVNRLRQDSAAMSAEYKMLQEDFNALQTRASSGATTASANTATGMRPSGSTYTPPTPTPNDNRLCARKQSQLTPDASYMLETLNRLNSRGWGVQVYSFSDLCSAVEKAEEFASYYKMFKTYIRVKEVDGRRVYTVVYGSLRDEAQARVYCENFRKIARTEEKQNAFVVQH